MSDNHSESVLRREMIQVAADCFRETGIKKTTLKTIAERAGVGLAEIKSEFSNKSMLVNAVQGVAFEEMQQEYLAGMPELSLTDSVKYVIKMRCLFFERNPEQTEYFFKKAFSQVEPWSSELDDAIWKLSIQFVSLFEKARRKGEIRNNVDIKVLVKTITSIYLTGVTTHGLRAQQFETESVRKFVEPQIDLLIDMITPVGDCT